MDRQLWMNLVQSVLSDPQTEDEIRRRVKLLQGTTRTSKLTRAIHTHN